MANVKIGTNTYNNINEVRLPKSDNSGEQNFVLPPVLQENIPITAPATGTTTVTAQSGYDAIQSVVVSPTPTETETFTTNGTYTPTTGKHYSQVTVNVSGSVPSTQEKTVTPTATTQNVTPDSGKYLSKVIVNGDADLVAGNIKSGVDIFGVTGTYSGSGVNLQTKTISPSTTQQNITADSGYDGLSRVTINAIQTETKSATPSTSTQNIVPSSGKYLTGVSVVGDADLVAGNIKQGVDIFGVTGTYTGSGTALQTKTVTPTTSQQNVTPDSGYDGLSSVTVNAIQTETKSATPTAVAQTITPSSGKYLTSVSVGAIQTETKSATPSATSQTITPSSGKYLTSVTVNGDADLTAGNIKKGVNIFGVTGTYEGSGGGGGTSIEPTSDTWEHNQWVTLTVDIDEEGNLSIRQSSGGGTTTGLKICYPQGSSTEITKIPSIPTEPGDYTLPITATWQGDSNNHTLNYTVVSSGDKTAHLYVSTQEPPSSAAVGDLFICPYPDTVTAGDAPWYSSSKLVATKNSTSMSSTGISITVYESGTFRFKCAGARTATSGTFTVQLYKGTSPISGAVMTWNSREGTLVADVECNVNDTINVYARSGSTSNYTIVGQLVACIDASEV